MNVARWHYVPAEEPWSGHKLIGPARVYIEGGGLLHVLVFEVHGRKVGVYFNRELGAFAHLVLVESAREVS